jgi:flavin reductase
VTAMTGSVLSDPPTIDAFRAGMRQLASGVCLVTTSHDGERHGFAATSVTGLSGEPPSLLVCINRATSGHAPLHGAGRFCVNVLAEDQEPVAALFSDKARRHERFRNGAWDGRDALRLARALAAFECRIDHSFDYGTHSIVVGLIETIHVDAAGRAPLVYFDARFRALA